MPVPPAPEPQSPCLHQCGFRDGCCKNCFRTQAEVAQWKTLTSQDKQQVLDLAAQRRLRAER